jgi:hypothetical protein
MRRCDFRKAVARLSISRLNMSRDRSWAQINGSSEWVRKRQLDISRYDWFGPPCSIGRKE